ncbi:MAG: hypothetical protein KA248_08465 [Kiritimatiellae bacterium]|nr:hypothetical protein [Kiritimatiellia bacterium]
MIALNRAWILAAVLAEGGTVWAGEELLAAPPRVQAVEVMRGEEGDLVFKLALTRPVAPDRVRILLDIDGPVRGEMATGADYMLENQVLYRYPPRAQGWKWDAVEPAVSFVEADTLTCFIPLRAAKGQGAWAVEILSDAWAAEDRYPMADMEPCDFDSLPPFRWTTALQPEDIADLLRPPPATLSRTLPALLDSWDGQPVDGPGPVSLPESCGAVLVARLTDAATGREADLQPAEVTASSNRVRWTGRALDVEWGLILQQDAAREISATGWLQADRTRCLRLDMGLRTDLEKAVWHEDFRFRRALSSSSGPARLSAFPFGVVTRKEECFMAETDPAEPRSFEIVADPARPFFGIAYDLALTPRTSNFPGRAFFRCTFRVFPGQATNGFRKALTRFYQEHPGFFLRQAPVCGFGRPFSGATDPRTLDLACEEPDLLRDVGGDEKGAPAGCLSFLRLEPWSYRLNVPARLAKDENRSEGLLKMLTAGSGRESELASAALVGGSRRPDGKLDWQESGRGGATGLFLRVSADPRLAPNAAAPLNRAMADWRLYRSVMHTAPVHGLFFEPPPAPATLDFNAAALGIADHPATCASGRWLPGLASPLACCADLAFWSAAVRASGGYVAGRLPDIPPPFAAPLLDVVVAEFAAWPGIECDPAREGAANAIRAMAGRKPVVAARKEPAPSLSSEELARHLAWCMFRGFLPGFFQRARGTDRIWEEARSDAALRAVLERDLPLIRRLATAGWCPSGPVEAGPEELWSEYFGNVRQPSGHVTLRNTSAERVRGTIHWPAAKEPGLLLDPRNGYVRVIPSGETAAPVALMPYEITALDGFTASDMQQELDFLGAWSGGRREASAGLTNLASIRSELEWGAYCNVEFPGPAVRGDRNEVRVEVANRGEAPLDIAELKVLSSRAYRPLDGAAAGVATGEAQRLAGYFEADDLAEDPWLEVQWTLSRGAERKVCVRQFKPRIADALVFDPPARRVEGSGDRAAIGIRVQNYSNRPRPLEIEWQGDHKGGRRVEELAPDSVRTLSLPVERKKARAGEIFVEIKSEGAAVLQRWFDVSFR